MNICPSCGGVIGRDCFNVQECAWITQDMAMRADHQAYFSADAHDEHPPEEQNAPSFYCKSYSYTGDRRCASQCDDCAWPKAEEQNAAAEASDTGITPASTKSVMQQDGLTAPPSAAPAFDPYRRVFGLPTFSDPETGEVLIQPAAPASEQFTDELVERAQTRMRGHIASRDTPAPAVREVVSVPVEATEEMVIAAMQYQHDQGKAWTFKGTYKAMLLAAPQAAPAEKELDAQFPPKGYHIAGWLRGYEFIGLPEHRREGDEPLYALSNHSLRSKGGRRE